MSLKSLYRASIQQITMAAFFRVGKTPQVFKWPGCERNVYGDLGKPNKITMLLRLVLTAVGINSSSKTSEIT